MEVGMRFRAPKTEEAPCLLRTLITVNSCRRQKQKARTACATALLLACIMVLLEGSLSIVQDFAFSSRALPRQLRVARSQPRPMILPRYTTILPG